MSWGDLIKLGVTLRPYNDPPPEGGTRSPFDAPFGQTLVLLARELRALDAKRIVLQVGYRDSDLRLDGMPRANARMLHDAVALSFESKWGPLRYATNEFRAGWYRQNEFRAGWYRQGSSEGWQQNLRAIALAMEALRKVDRYGVSKRGEQYTGWLALPQSTDPADSLVTRDQAIEAIYTHVSDRYDRGDIDGPFLVEALREALRRTHPDRGGDAAQFRRVMKAKELLT